jgi:glycine/D-amino acid oxidase-like deaminating enzyme
MLHAEDLEKRADPRMRTLDEATAAELAGRARALLALDGTDLRIIESRVSFRPRPADGLPAVGPVPDAPGAYLACTHSGVTLAAILARLVTREVSTGDEQPLLAFFRPGRLA